MRYRPSGPVFAAKRVPGIVTRTPARDALVSWAVTPPAMEPVSWAPPTWIGSNATSGSTTAKRFMDDGPPGFTGDGPRVTLCGRGVVIPWAGKRTQPSRGALGRPERAA